MSCLNEPKKQIFHSICGTCYGLFFGRGLFMLCVRTLVTSVMRGIAFFSSLESSQMLLLSQKTNNYFGLEQMFGIMVNINVTFLFLLRSSRKGWVRSVEANGYRQNQNFTFIRAERVVVPDTPCLSDGQPICIEARLWWEGAPPTEAASLDVSQASCRFRASLSNGAIGDEDGHCPL